MRKYPKVSIILINWNNYKDTSECLDSLGKTTYQNYEIIIVDNGSTDGSYQRLLKKYPQYKFIRNEQNLGDAIANNIGMRHALKKSIDYILILNNDTVVKKDFLEPMVSFLENHQEAGVAGGKIYYYAEPNKIWTIGGDVQLLRGGSVYYGGGEKDKGQFNEIKEFTHISGCMSLIKREVLEKVGLLSEQYFLRGSEWDFCYRVSKAGYKLFYIPDSVIWHKVSRTIKRFAPEDIYNGYRAKLIFTKNFLPRFLWVFWYYLFYLYATFFAPKKFKKLAKKEFNVEMDVNKIKKAISFALKDGWNKDKVTPEDIDRIKTEIT